jgi:hypothetical protein
MRKTMNAKQAKRIVEHGEQLLALFPNASNKNPVSLCKRLRRLENRAHTFALRLCNGPEMSEEKQERFAAALLEAVDGLLKFSETGPAVFLNRDPRGYALKIEPDDVAKSDRTIHQDWGGYGIIAPEF